MPRKGHSPEQVLNKLRQVEVAVAGGKSVGQAVLEIGVTDQSSSVITRCSTSPSLNQRVVFALPYSGSFGDGTVDEWV